VRFGGTGRRFHPAGKSKKFTSDAFGNLIAVTEPDPANPTAATFVTNYTYNGANQLTTVSMPRNGITQTRTLVWTGADLTSATNPENGTVRINTMARITARQRIR